jgi:hypothetical protein
MAYLNKIVNGHRVRVKLLSPAALRKLKKEELELVREMSGLADELIAERRTESKPVKRAGTVR